MDKKTLISVLRAIPCAMCYSATSKTHTPSEWCPSSGGSYSCWLSKGGYDAQWLANPAWNWVNDDVTSGFLLMMSSVATNGGGLTRLRVTWWCHLWVPLWLVGQ